MFVVLTENQQSTVNNLAGYIKLHSVIRYLLANDPNNFDAIGKVRFLRHKLRDAMPVNERKIALAMVAALNG